MTIKVEELNLLVLRRVGQVEDGLRMKILRAGRYLSRQQKMGPSFVFVRKLDAPSAVKSIILSGQSEECVDD